MYCATKSIKCYFCKIYFHQIFFNFNTFGILGRIFAIQWEIQDRIFSIFNNVTTAVWFSKMVFHLLLQVSTLFLVNFPFFQFISLFAVIFFLFFYLENIWHANEKSLFQIFIKKLIYICVFKINCLIFLSLTCLHACIILQYRRRSLVYKLRFRIHDFQNYFVRVWHPISHALAIKIKN